MMAPVSVVIPCYRCSDTIRRAVASVIAQTRRPAEILLVDDCSPDQGKTVATLRSLQNEYGADCAIQVIELAANGGPGTARNVGWEKAGQPYVAFLDADDSWHPRKIEIQHEWMDAHPEVDLTGHPSCLLESAEVPETLSVPIPATPVERWKFLLSNSLPTRSIMLRRQKIAHRFCPGKRYAEDYLLWLNIMFAGHAVWRIEAPLAFSYKPDFGDSGLTGNLWKMERGELDTYRRIYDDGAISAWVHAGVRAFSMVKFLRRLIVAFFRTRR